MKTPLPPLNAMRCFEAAARRLSFTAAARELHVTNAAVSHQIKSLEQWLGADLFIRRNNRLELTAAGETWLPRVRHAFSLLRESTRELLALQAVRLRLAVRPAFCLKWLLPRLPDFYASHPQVHLDLETEVDRDYLHYDLTIDYRPAKAADYIVRHLFSTPFVPVCSPAYAAQIDWQGDLSQVAFLHDRPLQGMPAYPDWSMWLAAAGAPPLRNQRGATFSTSLMSIEAALAGNGLALGQSALVRRDLQAARLHVPLPWHADLRMPYYLIYPLPALDNPGVQALIDWLLSQAQEEERRDSA
ncbi:LysR substrate-binding domain-containing protein [Massilia sp. W12]|uniref:LysR substrate-binding domain-containing protein n=1 Tax=Massilia sp. W12 TaxID=3126507 RepID=UPI0030CAE3B5